MTDMLILSSLTCNHSSSIFLRYISACKAFLPEPGQSTIVAHAWKEPPAMLPLPTSWWFREVYLQSVMSRYDEDLAKVYMALIA